MLKYPNNIDFTEVKNFYNFDSDIEDFRIVNNEDVKRFNPDLLKLVSDYKNSQRVYKNFRDNWSKVKLDPNVKVLIQEQSTV